MGFVVELFSYITYTITKITGLCSFFKVETTRCKRYCDELPAVKIPYKS